MPIQSQLHAVRPATFQEIQEILGWTLSLWGAGLSFESYLTRTLRLLQTPWGELHYRFMVGVSEEGELFCACKRYHLDMRLFKEDVLAVGFGAVFTPEGKRGRGHAPAMLRRLMEQEAANGTRLAILFSDIGTDYYERLGFHRLATLRAEAEALEGVLAFEPLDPGDFERVDSWRNVGTRDLEFGRSPDYLDFLFERSSPVLFAYAPEGKALGYAAVQLKPDRLWIEEVAFDPSVERTAFYEGLRVLAASRGASRVAGWLPSEAALGGFELTELAKEVPMVAMLHGDRLPVRTAFWSLDHF